MGDDVQTVRIELRPPAQVALQHGGLPLHAGADDPAARKAVQLQETLKTRGMNRCIARDWLITDHRAFCL
jgi:hypothetical protein